MVARPGPPGRRSDIWDTSRGHCGDSRRFRASGQNGIWVFELAASERYIWIAIVLLGSLLEAAYLFGWLGWILLHADGGADRGTRNSSNANLLPVFGAAVLLVVTWPGRWCHCGVVGILGAHSDPHRFRRIRSRRLAGARQGTTGHRSYAGWRVVAGPRSIGDQLPFRNIALQRWRRAFCRVPLPQRRAPRLPRASCRAAPLAASAAAGLHQPGVLLYLGDHHPFVLFSGCAPPHPAAHALSYLLFSLVAAFFLLVGFAMAHAVTGTSSLTALRISGAGSDAIFILLAIGFLIKAGAIGVHVWLPGVYAQADDDLSAILSALVSKVAMFGLLVGTYVAARSPRRHSRLPMSWAPAEPRWTRPCQSWSHSIC